VRYRSLVHAQIASATSAFILHPIFAYRARTRCEVDDGVVARGHSVISRFCRRDRLGIGIFATNMEARDLRKQLTIVPI
jgi:hypothetical protein